MNLIIREFIPGIIYPVTTRLMGLIGTLCSFFVILSPFFWLREKVVFGIQFFVRDECMSFEGGVSFANITFRG